MSVTQARVELSFLLQPLASLYDLLVCVFAWRAYESVSLCVCVRRQIACDCQRQTAHGAQPGTGSAVITYTPTTTVAFSLSIFLVCSALLVSNDRQSLCHLSCLSLSLSLLLTVPACAPGSDFGCGLRCLPVLQSCNQSQAACLALCLSVSIPHYVPNMVQSGFACLLLALLSHDA